ncbi:MAG: peptidylprolyl isomerase [Flexilinea sp.]|nr:peptidylprolyl isomerase [Flexilinea sp.]
MSENLVVAKDVVVGLAYTLYVENAVEDSAPAADPLEYLHGHGNLISGLEKALEGMKVGDKKNVTVEPEEAYGEYDPENVIKLERSLFPEGFPIEKGRLVPLQDDEGNHIHSYIVEWTDDDVTVDLNPPMAGKTLVFDCEIVSLRPGTAEEIEAGGLDLGGCGCDCESCGHDCH